MRLPQLSDNPPTDKLISFLVSQGSSNTKNEPMDFFDMAASTVTLFLFNKTLNLTLIILNDILNIIKGGSRNANRNSTRMDAGS